MYRFILNPVFLQRLLQSFLGFFTLILVVQFLYPDVQGWYYTFSSVASLYILFDFGLYIALINLASHQFSRLNWKLKGEIDGLSDNFLGLSRYAVKFYFISSLLFFLTITSVSIFFFSIKDRSVDNWIFAWISLTTFTALNFLTSPFLALIEGTGEIDRVYYLRTAQNFLSTLFLGVGLMRGYGLWCLMLVPMTSFLVALIWLLITKINFLKMVIVNTNEKFLWRKEV